MKYERIYNQYPRIEFSSMCRLKMVVFTKELMSQSLEQFPGVGPATFSELQERTNASLVCTSSLEPPNNTNTETSALSSVDIDEGTLEYS